MRVFKATLSCIGVSIVSGGAVERLKFLDWVVLVLFYSGFVSPAIVHWTNKDGCFNKITSKDLGRAGFIFYSADVAGLIVTIVSKPRKYRFDLNNNLNFWAFSSIYVTFSAIMDKSNLINLLHKFRDQQQLILQQLKVQMDFVVLQLDI
ncbi:unnamed protein product [Paramecium sonneborni]|uniref:Ammonium transporter AmtB-like domain-containing protein n=1 Tax=Paramecium sonneborni TaxID=65129 RepID=A0A8S1KRT9_9CILI|nr:unnamed protein product [Paramecium sonneborni]